LNKTTSVWEVVIALAGTTPSGDQRSLLQSAVLVLIAGVMLAGFSIPAARGQKKEPPARKEASTSAPALAKIWKSQSSNHEFRVKVENDLFTAEWVNLPPVSAKLGAYIRHECRRAGTKWIGISRMLLPCARPGEAPGKITHTCPMTLRFEVDEITPERISGRGESLKDFNCETCQVRQTGWARYVWVPKKQGTGNRAQGTGDRE
jgi:hypothetical protein